MRCATGLPVAPCRRTEHADPLLRRDPRHVVLLVQVADARGPAALQHQPLLLLLLMLHLQVLIIQQYLLLIQSQQQELTN